MAPSVKTVFSPLLALFKQQFFDVNASLFYYALDGQYSANENR